MINMIVIVKKTKRRHDLRITIYDDSILVYIIGV